MIRARHSYWSARWSRTDGIGERDIGRPLAPGRPASVRAAMFVALTLAGCAGQQRAAISPAPARPTASTISATRREPARPETGLDPSGAKAWSSRTKQQSPHYRANTQKQKIDYADDSPPPTEQAREDASVPAISVRRLADGSRAIARTDIQRLVDFGANNFIALVDVRPAFRRGRFLGWRVLGYRGPGQLRTGDVVLRVNGRSLERPAQFIAVWNSLATARVLVVELMRSGRRVRLVYAIV